MHVPGPEKHEHVLRQYEAEAADYDRRWSSYSRATLGAALRHVRCDGTETVLDLACGTGELARRMLERWPGLRIHGIDLSSNMLGEARRKLIQRPLASFTRAEVSVLPFRDESFDLAITTNSFHYFRQPLATSNEIHRVLRPGGRLLVVDWCHDYWTCKVCEIYLRLVDPAHFKMYGMRSCSSLLEEAHLRVTTRTRFKVGLLWGLMVIGSVKPASAS